MKRTVARRPTLRLTAALVACILPSGAYSANWIFVGNCGDDPQVRAYSYDAESIRKDGKNVLVWVKGDYSRLKGFSAREAKMLWSFDCPSKALVELSRAEYGAAGELLTTYGERTASMAIPSGSMADKVGRVVCA